MDPLSRLPQEVVLRLTSFASLSQLGALSGTSKAWSSFLSAHENVIYRRHAEVEVSDGEPKSLKMACSESDTPGNSFEGVKSWKEFCRRQVLLARNWESKQPRIRQSFIDTGGSLVWRFRPDFENRWVISTAHHGGVQVTDMDTSELLWSIPAENVRPHAHLEHSHGYFVFDKFDNALEVWRRADLCPPRTSDPALPPPKRGEFVPFTILHQDLPTRGFHLSFPTLCVVSHEGRGYIYDLSVEPEASLVRTIDIEYGAVGHLEQNNELVMYSLGERGYHIFEKATGTFRGVLPPRDWSPPRANLFHIHHPSASSQTSGLALQRGRPASVSLGLQPGPRDVDDEQQVSFDQDEWGAGMFDGPYMVSISRFGRVMICTDWPGVLSDPTRANSTLSIIECENEGTQFDLGGWLSVKHGRLLVEVVDRIYVIPLPPPSTLPNADESHSPIHAITSSSSSQLPIPISFMSIHKDAILATFASVSLRPRPNTNPQNPNPGTPRLTVCKHIRVLNFAPCLSPEEKESGQDGEGEENGAGSGSGSAPESRNGRGQGQENEERRAIGAHNHDDEMFFTVEMEDVFGGLGELDARGDLLDPEEEEEESDEDHEDEEEAV